MKGCDSSDLGILHCHGNRTLATKFSLVRSADHIGFVRFARPKIGFEFGVFGSGSVQYPSLLENNLPKVAFGASNK